MLNRRHLRIKVLHALYAFYQGEYKDLQKGEDLLFDSISKMYDMYLYLLLMVVEMQGAAIELIEQNRNKKLPSKEDLHPNTRFVTNVPLRLMANSKGFRKECADLNISWDEDKDLIKKMFRTLIETEDYKEYMSSSERGYSHDRIYLVRFFRKHMVNFEMLHEWFEEKSILWNDDLDLAASMVIKTIKTFDEDEDDIQTLPVWKDEKDEKDFIVTLFRDTLDKSDEYSEMIKEYAKNWELDRIAIMDMILMKMAVSEAQNFQSIPLKVTLNEYIELAKFYSTEKSSGFINGVLDQIFNKLKEDEKILKVGRGLVE